MLPDSISSAIQHIKRVFALFKEQSPDGVKQYPSLYIYRNTDGRSFYSEYKEPTLNVVWKSKTKSRQLTASWINTTEEVTTDFNYKTALKFVR